MNEKKTSAAGKKAAGKKIEGSLTEALGKLTGDKETEAKGALKKREGEAEETASPNTKPSKG